MDKIGVKIGLNSLSRAAVNHLRFNTIKRKIQWDLWDLCEHKPTPESSVRFNTIKRKIQ